MTQHSRYELARAGSAAAIVGSLLAMVGNLVHPVTPRDDPPGVAHVIADSALWTPIHLVIIAGLFLMLPGLVALRHSLDYGTSGALARLGEAVAIVGLAVGTVTVILDGVAAKQLADGWAAAPAADKAIALAALSANETANFALASLFSISFAGVPFILYGLAVVVSDVYPRTLGWVGLVAGVFSIFAGLVQAWSGEPTNASLILTIIGPTVITLWVIVMAVLVARRGSVVDAPRGTGTAEVSLGT